MNTYKVSIYCSVFFILFAVLVWLFIPVGISSSSLYTAGNEMLDSRFVPRLLVIILIFASGVNIAMNLLNLHLAKKAGRELPVMEKTVWPEELQVLLLAGILLLYALLLKRIGFLLSTALASVLVLGALRVKKWYYYVISLAFGVVVYFVFTRVLYVMLP